MDRDSLRRSGHRAVTVTVTAKSPPRHLASLRVSGTGGRKPDTQTKEQRPLAGHLLSLGLRSGEFPGGPPGPERDSLLMDQLSPFTLE